MNKSWEDYLYLLRGEGVAGFAQCVVPRHARFLQVPLRIFMKFAQGSAIGVEKGSRQGFVSEIYYL